MKLWAAGLALAVVSLLAPAQRLAAADQMTIDSAIESLADEDAATRDKAQAFLEQQGDAAIPALKKALQSTDPEIRRRAQELLTIARREPIRIQVLDGQDQPVAGAKFEITVVRESDAQQALTNPGGGDAKPVLDTTLTTDAKGIVSTEEINRGRYAATIRTSDPLPPQSDQLEVAVGASEAPVKWKIKRGAGVTLTVEDADGKPLADAAVLFDHMDTQFSSAALRNVSDRKFAKMIGDLPAESKTDAQGQIHLKEQLNVPGRVTIFHPGFARVEKTGFTIVDGQANDLGTVKLTPIQIATVTMKLVDEDRKPLKGLTVIVVDAEDRETLAGYVQANQLPKVLAWKFARSAGPSDDAGVAKATLPPGRYAFAVARPDGSSLEWVSTVENGVDLDCGTVVLPKAAAKPAADPAVQFNAAP